MNNKNPAIVETLKFAIWETILSAAMVGVFALLDKFSIEVLIGGVIGCLCAIGNFFFMSLSVMSASKEGTTKEEAAKKIRASFIYRLLFIGAILVVAILSKKVNAVSLLIPLLFIRPILLIEEAFMKSGDRK